MQDGANQRLFLNDNGVAEYRLPLELLHVARVGQLWGPGRYQGQWMGVDDGKWKGLGRIASFEILPSAARAPAREPRRYVAGAAGAELEQPVESTRSQPPPAREDAEIVDARVRAEREIAKLRLETERELNAERLKFHEERMRAEMDELRELVRRGRGDDDEREPGPWDWLGTFLEKLAPSLQEAAPHVVAKLLAAGQTSK